MELQRDKSLERFRTEYEKLFKAVRKSHGRSQLLCTCIKGCIIYAQQHTSLACSALNLYVLCCCSDNEKRLTKKVKELNGEIVGNAAKVQTALRLSEEDQTTIVTLKKEVEKAWKLVDASHEKVPAIRPHGHVANAPAQLPLLTCLQPATTSNRLLLLQTTWCQRKVQSFWHHMESLQPHCCHIHSPRSCQALTALILEHYQTTNWSAIVCLASGTSFLASLAVQ